MVIRRCAKRISGIPALMNHGTVRVDLPAVMSVAALGVDHHHVEVAALAAQGQQGGGAAQLRG